MITLPVLGYDDTTADESGNIYVNGSLRTTYVNGDGYLGCSVKLKEKWVTVGVQRLVALAHLNDELDVYKSLGYNPAKLTVNHFDLDKTNNHISNLDWCTVSENNIHQFLMSNQGPRNSLVAFLGKEKIEFLNLKHASERLNVDPREIWLALKWNRELNGYLFFHIPSSFVLDGMRYARTGKHHPKKKKTLLNLETNEITKFESGRELALSLGVSPSLITIQLSKDKIPKVLLGKYLVFNDGEEFPIDAAELLKSSPANAGINCIATNLITNEKKSFQSAHELISSLNLSKKAVYNRIASGNEKPVGDWVITNSTAIKA